MVIKVANTMGYQDDNEGMLFDLISGKFRTKDWIRNKKIDSLLEDSNNNVLFVECMGKSRLNSKIFFKIDTDKSFNEVFKLLNKNFKDIKIVPPLEDE